MRTILLALVAAAMASSSYAQYSARRLTQRIAPQVRPQQQPQQPQPQVPQQPPPQQPPQQALPNYSQYQYATAPATVSRPVDPVKAAAEKAKNEEKQFDYFKRRAEEGSDHAQYELGLRYLAGKGTAPDEKLAREWLAKAAKNGNSQAAKKLSELGGEPEKAEATPSSDNHSKSAESKAPETK